MLIAEDADIEEAAKRQEQHNPAGAAIPGSAAVRRPGARAVLPGVRVYPQGKPMEHIPESNLARPDLSLPAASLTQDLERLLLVVPMVEAQRDVIVRAIRVLKALG